MRARYLLIVAAVLVLAALACNASGGAPTDTPPAAGCSRRTERSIIAQQPDWQAAFGCPTSASANHNLVWQPFERGSMLLNADLAQVLVLFGDGRLMTQPDLWQPGMPDQDPAIVPPAGLLQPRGSLGAVWRDQPGVRDGLGFATTEAQSYSGFVQEFMDHQTVILEIPNGDVVATYVAASQWERLRVKTVPGYYGTP